MATFDIILNKDGELIAENGDFKTGLNDNNLIRYNVQSFPGEYKEFPLSGIGISRYLNSNVNIQIIKAAIIQGLKADVFPAAKVNLKEYPNVIKINNVEIES